MIAILSEYSRSETTIAAIRLAEIVLGQGGDVHLVATGRQERCVHPFWDRRVLSGKHDGVYCAVRGASHVVHFDVSGRMIEQVNLVAPDAMQVVVPRWHSLTAKDYPVLQRYRLVVCTGKVYYDKLSKNLNNLAIMPKLTWARWDSGLPPIRRPNLVEPGRVKACFLCGASTVDFCGMATLQLINALLTHLDTLDIAILSTKSWSRRERQKLKQMTASWGSRLVSEAAGDLLQQTRMYNRQDWLVLPGVRDDFGLHAQRALACGVPVIAYDVWPWNEIIAERHNGTLMPCEIATNDVDAPLAIINMGDSYKVCLGAFTSPTLRATLCKRNWHLEGAQQAFDDYWALIFNAEVS